MFNWPLMINNVERQDLDLMIEHLKEDDPKLTHGTKVREFEEVWSNWLGTKYSVMLNSGASANDLTMLALFDIYGDGEIIVPPLTWVSDIASVINAGFTPIFVDINFQNLSFNFENLVRAVTKKTRAIFLTHVLGINALTEELIQFCDTNNILLIEDVCESHGARHGQDKAGSFGFASNFSFYYAHHMTTIEGGMVSTNDFDFYQIIRMLRSHGMVREASSDVLKKNYQTKYPDLNPDFIFAHASHNMRPTELNGIMGLSQIARLDSNILLRTNNFKTFLTFLDSDRFHTDLLFEGSSNYAFPIILREPSVEIRNKVEEVLRGAKIEFRRGLSGGGNQIRQPYVKKFFPSLDPSKYPIVDHVHFYSWYVGNYPGLKSEQVHYLCDLLNGAF